ncbi:GSCOCG00007909001-RA-CDS [Cotesia congregata]|nr:GSCOCG00007909001-RA-CDS [Cotesia congregata]
MYNTMRSTLQTVPESVPADRVTNPKVTFKIFH